MEDEALIQRLLFSGEGDALDFKLKQYEFENANDDTKSVLLKDVLAFVNTWRTTTAYILIGIRDGTREVVGLDLDIDDSRLQQFINGKTNRPIQFSYRTIPYNGKTIGLYSIPVQDRPAYIVKRFGKVKADTVYVRRGSSTTEAKPDEIAKMGAAAMAAQTHSPRLSIKLISSDENATPIDVLRVNYTDFVLEDEILPDFPREEMRYPLPPGEFHHADYYRELIPYMREQENLINFKIEIENTGDAFADDVKLFLTVPSSEGFKLAREDGLLDDPPPDSRYSRCYARDPLPQIAFRRERDTVTAIFSVGKIQSGEKIYTQKLFFLHPPENLTEINIRVLSDQLKAPIELRVPSLIEIVQKELTMHDIDDFMIFRIRERARLMADWQY